MRALLERRRDCASPLPHRLPHSSLSTVAERGADAGRQRRRRQSSTSDDDYPMRRTGNSLGNSLGSSLGSSLWLCGLYGLLLAHVPLGIHAAAVRGKSSSSVAEPEPEPAHSLPYHAPRAHDRHLAVGRDAVRIVVEGHGPALFACRTCTAAVQDEQQELLSLITRDCPSATLIRAHQKLLNALTISYPLSCLSRQPSVTAAAPKGDALTLAIDLWIRKLIALPETHRVYVGANWQAANLRESVEYLGASLTTQNYCLTGQGVRVAVLDSGVDYTHQALSGNGTSGAYVDAYGFTRTDPANTQRGAFFPTPRVVDGYDFLGDLIGPSDSNFANAVEDDDPIDGPLGHGTGVAHALLGVASQAQLVALKVCATSAGCPDFAILSAMEYALDPNGDNDTSDAVDIINLSLGRPYTHPYYSAVSKAIEDAYALGVLTVVAAGNFGNRPGIIFEAASTPNALAVGATGVAESSEEGGMADYSSRGPSAAAQIQVKPDLVAPGGPFDLAAAGTGDVYHKGVRGTSYSTPIVAGAAALIKERCPECSPFAIKTILCNNANRNVRYTTVDASRLAPISWAGAGELQVYKAITADFWAYNSVDLQPSISLGVLNVARDLTVTKTVRVTLLDDQASTEPLGLRASFVFRDPRVGALGVLDVSFSTETFSLDRSCGAAQDVSVTFAIDAASVPSNHMTTSGLSGIDPVVSLDPNEVDGWIVFSTTTGPAKDVSLPFHSILRKASDITIAGTRLPDISTEETVMRVGIENVGAGVAQIDTYQLVQVSEDDPEAAFGTSTPPADLRYVGYRTIELNEPLCDYLVEFVFNTWETVVTSVNTFFEAQLDLDSNGLADRMLSNRGPQQHRTNYTECRVFDTSVGTWSCLGLAPDHSTYSSNTVIRGCSNDLGLDASTSTTLNVRFAALSFAGSFSRVDTTGYVPITFPNPVLSGPSFDVEPGASWSDILISGSGRTPEGQPARGLLLITNSYRTPSSTGASVKGKEAIAILRDGEQIFTEQTPDELFYPSTNAVDGPACVNWAPLPASCTRFENPAISSVLSFDEIFGQPDQPGNNGPPLNGETCFEASTPRQDLSTRFPTSAPTLTPTMAPSPEELALNFPPTGVPATSRPTLGNRPSNPSSVTSGANVPMGKRWGPVVLLSVCCLWWR